MTQLKITFEVMHKSLIQKKHISQESKKKKKQEKKQSF